MLIIKIARSKSILIEKNKRYIDSFLKLENPKQIQNKWDNKELRWGKVKNSKIVLNKGSKPIVGFNRVDGLSQNIEKIIIEN